jgi:hypothetical protein
MLGLIDKHTQARFPLSLRKRRGVCPSTSPLPTLRVWARPSQGGEREWRAHDFPPLAKGGLGGVVVAQSPALAVSLAKGGFFEQRFSRIHNPSENRAKLGKPGENPVESSAAGGAGRGLEWAADDRLAFQIAAANKIATTIPAIQSSTFTSTGIGAAGVSRRYSANGLTGPS